MAIARVTATNLYVKVGTCAIEFVVSRYALQSIEGISAGLLNTLSIGEVFVDTLTSRFVLRIQEVITTDERSGTHHNGYGIYN